MGAWKQTTLWGILRDGDPGDTAAAFNAGHLNDALRLRLPPYNPLLVASDTSGVWLADESGGPAIPLSWDWPHPHLTCLSPGYHSESHVYAAGTTLHETDTTQPAPLYAWREITMFGEDDRHRIAVGEIHRVIVVREMRKIVLATDRGVYWATIPAPGGAYFFKHADSLPGKRYSGLAEGTLNQVIAGAWGSDLQTHCGIFSGDWSGPGGSLVFKPAKITSAINRRQMTRVDIAACATDRRVLYAVSGGSGVTPKIVGGMPVLDGFGDTKWDGDDFIFAVLRSNDGGVSWDLTGSAVNGQMNALFPGDAAHDLAGHTSFGYVGCVGVSPFKADIVAVGIVNPFLSTDGGKRWEGFPEETSAHRHEDTHGLVFDPLDPETLHVCSDGGLASTPDLGKTWQSPVNRQLPNLQFKRFAASGHDSGVIAGTLQDNGDLYTSLYPTDTPWRDMDGGDGSLSMFADNGDLIYRNNQLITKNAAGMDVEFGAKPRDARWDPAKRQFADVPAPALPDYPLSLGVILVDGTSDGLIVNGLSGDANVIEVLNTTGFMSVGGEFLMGVAAEGEAVFGLFQKADKTFHWQPLATIPHRPDTDPATGAEKPYYATAAASLDGDAIFVGMNNGKIFRLDAPAFAATNLSDPSISAEIRRFAVLATDHVFTIADGNVFRWNGTKWAFLTTGLPVGETFQALEADRTSSSAHLFVATDSGVWDSEDDGKTWFGNTGNLPAAPGCRDLRFVRESSGATFMYLSTYGWSAFKQILNFEDVMQTVTINGHMDLVDRQLVEDDITANPTFLRIFTLGPFHPFEGFVDTEDDGDEVRVVLKVDLEWKIDRSVVVKFDATMIAKDEDDEEEDRQTGTLTVAFGKTGTQTIDLVSEKGLGDWTEPDRAHIEFTVTN